MRATDPNPPHPPSARRVSGNGERHWGGVLGSLGVGFQHITEYIWGPAWSGRDGFRKRLCQHIKPRVGIGSPNRKVIKMAKILFFVGLVNIWVGVFLQKTHGLLQLCRYNKSIFLMCKCSGSKLCRWVVCVCAAWFLQSSGLFPAIPPQASSVVRLLQG